MVEESKQYEFISCFHPHPLKESLFAGSDHEFVQVDNFLHEVTIPRD